MISEVVISDKEYKCCVCGRATKYIEINYEAPFCSDECIYEMDKQVSLGGQDYEQRNNYEL